MSSSIYAHIRANPKFERLVRTRSRFAWSLSAIVLTAFYGFVMIVAFRPAALARPIAEGSMVTVGVAAGLTIFVSFWILVATYVWRANGEFDALTGAIVKEAREAELKGAVRAKEVA
jgi:cation/acetate symporter